MLELVSKPFVKLDKQRDFRSQTTPANHAEGVLKLALQSLVTFRVFAVRICIITMLLQPILTSVAFAECFQLAVSPENPLDPCDTCELIESDIPPDGCGLYLYAMEFEYCSGAITAPGHIGNEECVEQQLFIGFVGECGLECDEGCVTAIWAGIFVPCGLACVGTGPWVAACLCACGGVASAAEIPAICTCCGCTHYAEFSSPLDTWVAMPEGEYCVGGIE